MDSLTLARWQFGITTVYHFFFVPLTLGLVWVVAGLHTAWVATRKPVYLKLTKFWGKLFLINFAMGVVTGIVQEFQFGMNWSEYSRYVGDVFGAPLAIEALLAFFLESTFLGIWIFGWDRLSPRMHLASIWLVAIGSNLSALWILIANSFMQQPVGYVVRNGRAEMDSFLALVTNPHVFVQFPHVITGAMATAAFFVLGISAWHLLRASGAASRSSLMMLSPSTASDEQAELQNLTTLAEDAENREAFRLSFGIGAVYGLIATVAVMVVGHTQAQYMMQVQPMKMAAAEALWDTENPAPMSLFTWGNEPERRDVFAIKVPGLLSFLAYNRFDGEVRGIRDLQHAYERQYGPGDYAPPVKWTYWTFRMMIGAGIVMLLLGAWATLAVVRGRAAHDPRLLALLVPAIALPYISNSAGWIFTEIGRQPWIVFGLQKTADAVSPTVTDSEVLFSLVVFTLVYGALMVVDVYLLRKYAKAGITDINLHGGEALDATPANA